MYNKYYNMQQAKFFMASFGYFKHKQKQLQFAQQHF